MAVISKYRETWFILQEKVEVSTCHLSYKLASFYLQLYNIYLKSYKSEQKYTLKAQVIFCDDWLITNKNILRAVKICDFIIPTALKSLQ